MLRSADATLGTIFSEHAADSRLLLFRLVVAGPAEVRSRRRPLADVVRVGPPPRAGLAGTTPSSG